MFPIQSGAAVSVREEAPTLSTTSTAAMSKQQAQPPQPIIKTYRVNYSVTEKQRFLKRSKRSIRWYVVASTMVRAAPCWSLDPLRVAVVKPRVLFLS